MSLAGSLRLDQATPASLDGTRRHRAPAMMVCILVAVAATVLFAGASVRHDVMRSGAFDMGFFDQAVYLISQGQAPISSLHGFHVLADHASIILYPLALLYLIWSDPHMLLGIQAIALAAGAWPIWKLALRAGLREGQAIAVAGAYLMYPLVLTSNLFDFHPDVIAVPALLFAVLSAREDRRITFCSWLAIALACKEVFALTVFAMGVWLILTEPRRFFGIVAMVAGAVWFIIALKLVIPWFGAGRNPSGMEYYSYLGGSLGEIVTNSILHPGIVLSHLLRLGTLRYLALLAAPVLWGLHYRTMSPLIAAIPAVLLNLLSTVPAQRSPFFQYSLPVVPFLFLAVILALAQNRAWLRRGRSILIWSCAMLALGLVARLDRIRSDRAFDWQTLYHTRTAIGMIDSDAKVLTTFETVPQLSQRECIGYVGSKEVSRPIEEYDFVLISTRHSSMSGPLPEISSVLTRAATSPVFQPEYMAGDVFLFKRIDGAQALMSALADAKQ